MNNPKTPYKFKPYAPKPHQREQDINDAQPDTLVAIRPNAKQGKK